MFEQSLLIIKSNVIEKDNYLLKDRNPIMIVLFKPLLALGLIIDFSICEHKLPLSIIELCSEFANYLLIRCFINSSICSHLLI